MTPLQSHQYRIEVLGKEKEVIDEMFKSAEKLGMNLHKFNQSQARIPKVARRICFAARQKIETDLKKKYMGTDLENTVLLSEGRWNRIFSIACLDLIEKTLSLQTNALEALKLFQYGKIN